ncbi:MAG: DUF4197 domain-containing protein [Deferrisomatales bacterium]|nr:DUF4197 domain-containing protein [Deferrisomatales bacterium]
MKMRDGVAPIALLGALLLAVPATGGWLDKAKELLGAGTASQTTAPNGTSGLGAEEIGEGLREALRKGTETAVSRASANGGFLENPQIRIPLPDRLQKAARTLKMIGMGSQADAFEETMNRAAETAAAKAAPIFGDAIAKLTFDDVNQIWKGGDTAATEYLGRSTRPLLQREFQPVVHAAAQEAGVTRSYQALTSQPQVSSLVAGTDLDLDHYVTEKALDGVFALLAEEEKRIRTDPVARTTDLLKKVFGQ